MPSKLAAFLKLAWANNPQQLAGIELGSPYITDFGKVVWRLKSRTMKNIKEHAKTRYSMKDFAPESLIRWLSSNDSSYLAAVDSSEAKKALAPLPSAQDRGGF
jgi:hypothetical protein